MSVVKIPEISILIFFLFSKFSSSLASFDNDVLPSKVSSTSSIRNGESQECEIVQKPIFKLNSTGLDDSILHITHTLDNFRSETKSLAIIVLGSDYADKGLILQHFLKQFNNVSKVMKTVQIEGTDDFVTIDPANPDALLQSAVTALEITNGTGDPRDKVLIYLGNLVNFHTSESEFTLKYFLREILGQAYAIKAFIMTHSSKLDIFSKTFLGSEFDLIMDSMIELFPKPGKLSRLGLIITGLTRNTTLNETLLVEEAKWTVGNFLNGYKREMSLEGNSNSLAKAELVKTILGEDNAMMQPNYDYYDWMEKLEELRVAVLWEEETCGITSLAGKPSEIGKMLKMYDFEKNSFKNLLKNISHNMNRTGGLRNVYSLDKITYMEQSAKKFAEQLTKYYQQVARETYEGKNVPDIIQTYGKIIDLLQPIQTGTQEKDKYSILNVLEGLNKIFHLEHAFELWESILEAYANLSILQVLDEIGGKNNEENENISRQDLLWNIVEAVQGYFETLIKSDTEVFCNENESEAVVSGRIVKLSDVINLTGNLVFCQWGKSAVKKIFIRATEKVYFDRDVRMPGLILTLMANTWETIGNRTINMDGVDGARHLISRAPKGFDGLPGNRGGNGGIFIGFIKKLGNNFTLKISASAGNGGAGQNGGFGNIGKAGRNASFRDFPAAKAFKEQWIAHKNSTDFNGQPFYFTAPGEKGADGGMGGRGGAGGFPGNIGAVQFYMFAENVENLKTALINPEHQSTKLKLIRISHDLILATHDGIGSVTIQRGLNGKDGEAGQPGLGGLNGLAYRCLLRNFDTDPFWDYCQQVLTQTGRGNEGAAPKSKNYVDLISPAPQQDLLEFLENIQPKLIDFAGQLKS